MEIHKIKWNIGLISIVLEIFINEIDVSETIDFSLGLDLISKLIFSN